ncbi:MAG: hypothetical protein HY399_02600, partial [Elusimicrobia bacterium]|nr:hypothetical protein [Elusimicrobiota bacterium]
MLFVLGPQATWGQVDVGAAIGPDIFTRKSEQEKEVKPTILPFAQSLAVIYDTSTWNTLQISTSTPAMDLTRLLYKGYYKLE